MGRHRQGKAGKEAGKARAHGAQAQGTRHIQSPGMHARQAGSQGNKA